MRKTIFIRFLLASIGCGLLLGLISLFLLRALTENINVEYRRHLTLSIAKYFEDNSIPVALRLYEESRRDRPSRPVWLVCGDGRILGASSMDGLPEKWDQLAKPEKVHDITLAYYRLGLTPSVSLIRLDMPQPTYLVIATSNEGHNKRDLLQLLLYGSALAFSALLSMLLTFFYLRRKSREAREILRRMEQGDLKARFAIKQFDEMGSLMLDFNRMAGEIERLVERLKETESARQVLFQELSHDLRTPLTSLKTSIETLALHWEQMPTDHRSEVLAVCQTEISYFMELLENLLFITQMDEPRYKQATDSVNLVAILEEELHVRQTHELSSEKPLNWSLKLPPTGRETDIRGDSHLIKRLIKNALENAARFAASRVEVTCFRQDGVCYLRIQDDGPGMSAEQIEEFGKMRTRRLVGLSPRPTSPPTHVSLGLGSVIMRRVVELHRGTLMVRSVKVGSLTGDCGTEIEIRLPA